MKKILMAVFIVLPVSMCAWASSSVAQSCPNYTIERVKEDAKLMDIKIVHEWKENSVQDIKLLRKQLVIEGLPENVVENIDVLLVFEIPQFPNDYYIFAFKGDCATSKFFIKIEDYQKTLNGVNRLKVDNNTGTERNG